MGIAGFYLWLEKLYPNCIEDIPQEMVDALLEYFEKRKSNGSEASENAQEKAELPFWPKPGVSHKRRNDNFYVDMNGLIHPCCHDTHPLPEPETEEEMLERCFAQLELLVEIVRPQKCLVLCIDGVAPRSKMNQQRIRRFRSAQEKRENEAISAECADEVIQKYGLPPPRVRERWDSNVITPATSFMERVGRALEWFILKKLNEDPNWKHLTVVFSDALIPGEGEHKIMHYIRGLRASKEYDANTTHVIHGMDADLICLGLITHERHVSILRNQLTETFQPDHSRFLYFNIETFRACLKLDFGDIKEMNFENVVDDFAFLCFLVGNDFLPHVPLISIKAKSIEIILDNYVRNFASHKYLTQNGNVNFSRFHVFLQKFLSNEMAELKKQYYYSQRAKVRAKQNVQDRVEKAEIEIDGLAESIYSIRQEEQSTTTEPNQGEGVKDFLNELQEKSDELFALHTSIQKELTHLVVDKQPLEFSYLSTGYRVLYYYTKFGWPEAEPKQAQVNPAALQQKVNECCAEYLRGMQWVMWYYTSGCPSWDWFYPFHYAPLLEDLAQYTGIVNVKMELGTPLHPVLQLLAVLPRESVGALPEELHAAVQSKDSQLDPFYPDDLNPDYSEANFSYQAVLRLEFVDCEKIKKAVKSLIDLKEEPGRMVVLCHESTLLSRQLSTALPSVGHYSLHSTLEHTNDTANTPSASSSSCSSAPPCEKKCVEQESEGEISQRTRSLVPIPGEVIAVVPIAGSVERSLPFGNAPTMQPTTHGSSMDASGGSSSSSTIGTTSSICAGKERAQSVSTEMPFLHQRVECPDLGLIQAESAYSHSILSNHVCCFSYAFLDPAPYNPQLLRTTSLKSKKRSKRKRSTETENSPSESRTAFIDTRPSHVLSSHRCSVLGTSTAANPSKRSQLSRLSSPTALSNRTPLDYYSTSKREINTSESTSMSSYSSLFLQNTRPTQPLRAFQPLVHECSPSSQSILPLPLPSSEPSPPPPYPVRDTRFFSPILPSPQFSGSVLGSEKKRRLE